MSLINTIYTHCNLQCRGGQTLGVEVGFLQMRRKTCAYSAKVCCSMREGTRPYIPWLVSVMLPPSWIQRQAHSQRLWRVEESQDGHRFQTASTSTVRSMNTVKRFPRHKAVYGPRVWTDLVGAPSTSRTEKSPLTLPREIITPVVSHVRLASGYPRLVRSLSPLFGG